MQSDVEAFHRVAGVTVGDLAAPAIPDKETCKLRLRLIDEELAELSDALLGCRDLTEAADAIADLLYVAFGTAVTLGIDIGAVWDAVHLSNMAKFPGGVIRRRVDGKILKPEGWTPPDIAGVLRDQILRMSLERDTQAAFDREFDYSDCGEDDPTNPWNGAR